MRCGAMRIEVEKAGWKLVGRFQGRRLAVVSLYGQRFGQVADHRKMHSHEPW